MPIETDVYFNFIHSVDWCFGINIFPIELWERQKKFNKTKKKHRYVKKNMIQIKIDFRFLFNWTTNWNWKPEKTYKILIELVFCVKILEMILKSLYTIFMIHWILKSLPHKLFGLFVICFFYFNYLCILYSVESLALGLVNWLKRLYNSINK